MARRAAGRWGTLVAVITGLFMLLLDVTIVIVALPDIRLDLHSSLSDLQWVIDAYALSLAASLLTAGVLADRFGRKAFFAAGTVVFTIGSLCCALAQSPLALTVSRAGQGVGGATMFATSLAVLAGAYRGRDRGVAFGVFGACAGVATAVGPVVGGLIVNGLSWRWIFLVNLPVGVFAVVATLLWVRESRDPVRRRLDWPGFVTFSGGLTALVYGLISGGSDGWTSGRVVGCFGAAAVLLATFVGVQLRRRDAMLDLGLLRKPTFTGGLVAAFAMSASLFAVLTYIVLFFQSELGYSPLGTGLRALVLSGAMFVAAGVAGRATARVSPRAMIPLGFVLVGAGMLLMRGLEPTGDWTHFIPGMIVGGIGAGLVNVPLAATAVGVVAPARAGMASGINSTLRQVGMATGIAALGSIFANQLRDGIAGALHGTPAERFAGSIGTGPSASAADLPDKVRTLVTHAVRIGFDGGLNDILLIGAVVALAAAVVTVLTVRRRDFVDQGAEDSEARASEVVAAA